MRRVKMVKYKVMEEDQTLGGKRTMKYTNVVLYSCMPEMCIILLNNVTPVNLS